MQDAQQAILHLRQIHLREVDRRGRGAVLPEARQLLGHVHRDRFLRLLGAAADVRREDDVAQSGERRAEALTVLGRLFGKHVGRGAREMAAAQRRRERLEIHHLAAAVVDQRRAALHLRKFLRADQVARAIGVGHMQAHHIGRFQHRLQRGQRVRVAERESARDVEVHHAHAQAFGQHAELAADVPVAHDAERAAAHFAAFLGALVPQTRVQLRALVEQASRQRDDLGQREFGDAARVGEGAVEHRHAGACRARQIHLIGADAEAAHGGESLRGRERCGGQTRLRSQADHRGACKQRGQLRCIRASVEPLHIEARLAQRTIGRRVDRFHQHRQRALAHALPPTTSGSSSSAAVNTSQPSSVTITSAS